MANLTKDQILEAIEKMTVLEISELVKAMEEKFGVSAAPVAVAGPAMAGAGGGQAQAGGQAEEKDSFDIVLVSGGQQKINVIKEVRTITGLGLKEAKDLVDAGNKVLKEGVAKAEAEEIKKKLEGVGATIELK